FQALQTRAAAWPGDVVQAAQAIKAAMAMWRIRAPLFGEAARSGARKQSQLRDRIGPESTCRYNVFASISRRMASGTFDQMVPAEIFRRTPYSSEAASTICVNHCR